MPEPEEQPEEDETKLNDIETAEFSADDNRIRKSKINIGTNNVKAYTVNFNGATAKTISNN